MKSAKIKVGELYETARGGFWELCRVIEEVERNRWAVRFIRRPCADIVVGARALREVQR